MKECLRDSPSMRPSAESIDQRLKQVEVVPTEIKSSHLQRSDEMWSKRFPYRVARSLKLGMEVQPQNHPAASVFYCEVVNHSEIVSSLPPQQASELLNLFHRTIDNLCQVHNVFRIETVGDSFLAVTNVAFDQPDHVRILTNFALEVMETFSEMRIDNPGPRSKPRSPSIEHAPMETKDESTQPGEQSTAQAESTKTSNTPPSSFQGIRIRVGLHTGSVVAHVVGSANPRFAILGDAVKVAKQLQGCSKPNKIHVSQDFAFELLQDAEDSTNDSVTLVRVEDVQVRKLLNMVTYHVRQAGMADHLWSDVDRTKGAEAMSTGTRSTRLSESNGSDAGASPTRMRSDDKMRSVLDKVRKNQAMRIQSANMSVEMKHDDKNEECILPLSNDELDAAGPTSSSPQPAVATMGLDEFVSQSQEQQDGRSRPQRRSSRSSIMSNGSSHSVRSDELYYKQIMESG
uniref:Guanylate cyclase domain-containing protein n=2 Tax=Craspedostauros australis TaxID=1486917 RepID=A0A7R9WRA1_9STRA